MEFEREIEHISHDKKTSQDSVDNIQEVLVYKILEKTCMFVYRNISTCATMLESGV